MKAQDLRIGNLIHSLETGETQLITDINEEYVLINAITWDYVSYKEIEPILLTEEWLLKFGFELQNTDEVWPDWKKDNFELLTDFGNGTYEYNPTAKEVLYVHQLQNLFYALTGEELTYEND